MFINSFQPHNNYMKYYYIPILQKEKLRHKEVSSAEGHITSKWESWDLNSESLVTDSVLFCTLPRLMWQGTQLVLYNAWLSSTVFHSSNTLLSKSKSRGRTQIYLSAHTHNIYTEVKWSERCTVTFGSLWPHGLYSPWNSPGQNTGVGSLSLLQGIFPTQGQNPGLLHCRRILY